MLFPADRTTKASHAINTTERRKLAIHLRIQGSIESQIQNRRPISVIVEGKQRHTLENCPAFGNEYKACKKPNHFASVCRSSQKQSIKQMTELSDDEQETDTDEFFYKLEVSSVQATGKQLHTSLEYTDPNARYTTKLDCQLDTGAACNVLTHRDLLVICQTGHPALQESKVKLPLFKGAVMKPVGEVALNVQKVGQSPHVLKFQVIEGDSKPLLSTETCKTLELLKINCNPTTQHM